LAQLSGTLSNGNLEYNLGSGTKFVSGTIAVKSGKYYWEAKAVSGTTNGSVGGRFGFSQSSSILHGENGPFTLAWHATSGIQVFTSGSYSTLLTGTNYADGDTLGCALDADSNIAYFYKNGSLAYTYNFSSYISAGSQFLTPTCWNGSSGTPVWTYNFGARAFAHSARTNHKCLNTANLTPPTIADGSQYFDAKLFDGNGGSQAITMPNSALSPDWVWIKNRNGGHNNMLFDIVRGAGADLQSNSTATEGSAGSNDLTSFDSNGFSLGSNNAVNQSGRTYVSWNWDAGTSTVTNNDGSIASQVRAQPSAGFSIVTYTGNGSASATVGHGLNASLGLVIHKNRGAAANWNIKHSSLASNHGLAFTTTQAQNVTTAYGGGGFANLTSSSTFGFLSGTSNANNVNESGANYVAYCFAPVAGYSAMGKYTGNGNASGPFVFTGFRPRLILIKRAVGGTANWCLYDSARDTFNDATHVLCPDTSGGGNPNDAFVSAVSVDFLSNGFRIVDVDGEINQNSDTYIYYAVSENPFQANGGLAR
jgi:hypothetical protein